MAIIIGALPVTLTNGTPDDATQVMADFNWILGQVNANGLARANNLSDVASAAAARANLGLGIVATQNATGIIGVQAFFVPGAFTYTPTAGTARIVVQLQGGGGGSSGCAATSSVQNSVGSPGGGGAWVSALIGGGFSGQAGVVGAGGAAGTAGANAGGNGGNTTFMTVTAGGGIGGAATFSGAGGAGGGLNISAIGGTFSGGNVGKDGESGGISIALGLVCAGGGGGSSFWGAGGSASITVGSQATPVNGLPFGGGAGAPANSASQPGTAGAAGAAGIALFYEFAQ